MSAVIGVGVTVVILSVTELGLGRMRYVIGRTDALFAGQPVTAVCVGQAVITRTSWRARLREIDDEPAARRDQENDRNQ